MLECLVLLGQLFVLRLQRLMLCLQLLRGKHASILLRKPKQRARARARKSEQRMRARKLCHCVLVLLDSDMAPTLAAVTLRTPLTFLRRAPLPHGFGHGPSGGLKLTAACRTHHTARCTWSCPSALQRCSARVHLSFWDTDALLTHLAAQCLFFSLERGRFGLPHWRGVCMYVCMHVCMYVCVRKQAGRRA